MHNHIDRDDYVEIKWDNIKKKDAYNFRKGDALNFDNFGTPYDFDSVMHYSSKAFSVNGEETIRRIYEKKIPVFWQGAIVGVLRAYPPITQGSQLSAGDALRLNKMYKCDGYWAGFQNFS